MRDKPAPIAIVFDLWYTLVCPEDHREPGVRTSGLIPEVLGFERNHFSAYWRSKQAMRMRSPRPLREYVVAYASQFGRTLSESELAAFDEVWMSHDLALTRPRPGVIDALRAMARDGYRLGLLSNAHEREMRQWEASPLAACFDAACFSFEIGAAKPEEYTYQEIVGRLGVDPGRAMFVGDGSSSELTGARAAGLAYTAFMRGFVAEQSVNESVAAEYVAQSDFVVDSMAELHTQLRERFRA